MILLLNSLDNKGGTWPQYLVTIAATIGYFTTCIHTGWPIPFVPKLQSEDYPFQLSNDAVSYLAVVRFTGNILGAVLGAFLLDFVGRHKTVLSISVPQFVSFLLIAVSRNSSIFLFSGRFIGGLAEGATYSLIPVYVSEIAEPRIRGRLNMIVGFANPTGFLFVNIVGSFVPIHISAVVFMMFPVLFVLSFWRMPESPYYLLMKNRSEEAEEVLRFLRRRVDVSVELATLSTDVQRQMQESGSYKDLFINKTNRMALLIAIAVRSVQQLTGYPAFIHYLQVLLKEATKSVEPYISSSIVNLFQLIAIIGASFFVDKFGRKPILLTSAIGCCFDLLSLAIYFYLKEHTALDLARFDLFPLVMMVLFNILYYLGLGVIAGVIVSELFSARIKSKAAAFTNLFYGLCAMFAIKYYQIAVDNFGMSTPYFSFSLFTFVGSVWLCFYLLETKGKTLGEIQRELGHSEDP